MAGNLDLLLEAEKRGILPDDKKALLDEARKRGLVAASPAAPQAQGPSQSDLEWAAYGLGGPLMDRKPNEGNADYLRRISVAMAQNEASNNAAAVRNLAAGASRLITSPGKLVTAGAQALGVPGADVANYQSGVNQFEQNVAGGPVIQPVASAGELAAGSAAPVGAASGARTLLQAVLRGTGTGALVGGTLGSDPQSSTPADVAKNAATRAAVGGAVGGTLSSIAGIWPAAKNGIKRLMDLANPVGKTAENIAAKNSDAAFKVIPMTPGEQSGSPALLAYQAKLVGKESLAFQNKQLDQYGKAMDDLQSTMTGSPDPKGAAIKLGKAVGRTSAKMQSAASKEYEDGLNAVRAKAAEGDGTVNIPFDNFEKSIKDAVSTYGGDTSRGSWYQWLDPTLIKADPKLQESIRVLDQARATGGQSGFDVPTVIRIKQAANYLRRGLNAGPNMSPAQKSQNRLGKSIADGIDADIDQFLGNNAQALAVPGQTDPTRDALRMLDDVNARYKQRLDQAAQHKAAFVSQAFGGKTPADAGDAFDRLMKMPEGEQVRALNIINDVDPTIADDMKAWKVSNTIQNMNDQVRSGNMSAIDPTQVVKDLTNGSKIVGERLWTPAELTRIKASIGSARTLMQAMPTGKPLAGSEAIDLGRTAGAAFTMSPPFVLMQVNRLFGRGRVAKLFFTEEGQKALNTLSSTYTRPTAKTIQALTTLNNISQSDDQSAEQ